jgi:hypothetical protein
MRKAPTIAALVSLVCVLSTGISVAAPSLQEQLCEITWPQANAQLRGSVGILGTARWSDFQFYKVEFSSSATPGAWAVIGDTHREQRVNETLETWHTTALPDGAYYLRLVVVRTDGNIAAQTEPVPVQIANMQPTPTPVPVETPTPSPTIFLPTPTPAIVEQPTTVIPPTATFPPEGTDTETPTPEMPRGISVPDLGVFVRQFVFGAFVATALFIFVGAVFLLRRLI